MRRLLGGIADALLYLSFAYGLVRGCIAFFQVQICRGWDNCYWFLEGFHWAIVALIFILVFLPISPFVSLFYSWPTYMLAAALKWFAIRGRDTEGVADD